MPHLVEARPSTTGPATAGIGTLSAPTTSTKHSSSSSPLAKESNNATFHKDTLNSDSDSSFDFSSDYDSFSEDDSAEDDHDSNSNRDSVTGQEHPLLLNRMSRRSHRRGRDLFSQLPAPILQQVLALLPPFQMLTISELSHKFYNFVVLGQEMNEVWFRLVKHEEAEEKKRLDWYKLKKLEQEQKSVQMMRSFSNSSTCSNMSNASGYGGSEDVLPLSKQAQRLLNKKQEAATGKSTSVVKVMKRSDRKKNWCKIYVDSILRGNGEDPLVALNQVVPGSAKRPAKFQTIVLNDPLPEEHFRDYQGAPDDENGNKEMSREAKIQAKMEKRMYYKSIRSKPKGKKAGQMDSPAAKVDKIASWRQPEWSEQFQADTGDY